MEWVGFVAQWFPSGSHGGTPRTFGIFGLYQRAGGLGENNGNTDALRCSLVVNCGVVLGGFGGEWSETQLHLTQNHSLWFVGFGQFYLQPEFSSPQEKIVLHLIAESRFLIFSIFAPVRSASVRFA